MHVVVLGAGLVGSAMIRDLASDHRFSVTAVDASDAALAALASTEHVRTRRADLSKSSMVREVVKTADLVICAVPGFMGFETLKTVIEAGVDVVDISFFPEDPFALDTLAKQRDVVAVVDCGVAPGLCNVMAGHVEGLLDSVSSYVCYVGGLPREPEWPYKYRSVFSPIDVLEEYTRPARYVENGKEVVKPALSDAEMIDFLGVGTLEVFNTDGLRTLARTLDAPDMKEKTLRWPGHIELMRVFRETGFFSKEKITVNGSDIAPIDVISKLLFEAWTMREGEEDLTVMQVILEGIRGDKKLKYTYDLLDFFDRNTSTTSMARTTGYTATIVARMVADGLYARKGVSPPEFLGRTDGCWNALLEGYAERGITVSEHIETV